MVYFSLLPFFLPAVKTSPAPVTTTTSTASPTPVLMQLHTSADYRSPLDPATKVQSDKRIYAEVRNDSLIRQFFLISQYKPYTKTA